MSTESLADRLEDVVGMLWKSQQMDGDWAVKQVKAAQAALRSMGWVSWPAPDGQMPQRHVDAICLNRDKRIFRGRICYGAHAPFWTFPQGDKDASDTCPGWIDVVGWIQPVPSPPTGEQTEEVKE